MTVRKATAADVPRLAEALARAFADDPMTSWVFPDDRARAARSERMFRVQLTKISLRHNEVYTTDDVVAGAIWAPPGAWRLTAIQQLRLLPSFLPIVGFRAPTLVRGLTAVEKQHPRELHWYLAVLGTEPASQGKGIGSALIAPVLARCDEDGVPAYLESS